MSAVEESEHLHDRVRRFAARASDGDSESFERLALEIARFQARWSPGFRRILDVAGGDTTDLSKVPGVPCDAFRVARVAVHGPELDEVAFETSGTTGARPGLHAMRTSATYRDLSLRFGRRALLGHRVERATVVACAPHPGEPIRSSLAFMISSFIEEWDVAQHADADAAMARERWILSDEGVDLASLRRAGDLARERDEPLLLLGTAFGLVALLDRLDGSTLCAPPRSVVMMTGGFKGRSREVAPGVLARDIANALGIVPERVIGEYGMTELTSQLYEATLPNGDLEAPRGVLVEPPWLRVEPVDPSSLRPVPRGEVGIARIIDLGNVDSAVVIVAQDQVRRRDAGIELLGRRRGAPPRGCSLAVEAMVGP